jgi:hypothetical protein
MSEMQVIPEPGFPSRSEERAAVPAPVGSGQASLCVLLAGHRAMRPGISVAHDLGIPVAALPIDADRSLAEAWDEAAEAASIARRRLLALTHASERPYFERSKVAGRGETSAAGESRITHADEPREGLLLCVDRADHRGAAGTVADLWDAETEVAKHASAGAFVIEASAWPGFDLRGFAAAVEAARDGIIRTSGADPERPWAFVGAAPAEEGADELRPAGVFYLSAGALRLVPRVGYFDLKEQLLAAIVGAGGRVQSWIGARRFARVVGRESYLEAIRMRLEAGGRSRADDLILESGAEIRGSTIACRGVHMGERSLVVDSAILPGARIGAGAIVARSVVPPGALVPQGAFVVDQVFASFTGTPGGSR